MHRALHSVAARLADTDPGPGSLLRHCPRPPVWSGLRTAVLRAEQDPGPSSSSAWAGAEGPGARGEAASPAEKKSLV